MRNIGDVNATNAPESASPGPPLWQRIRLFQGLEATAIEAISGRLSLRSFPAGETLIQQNRWCGELFIVQSGVAQVSITQTDEFVMPSDDGREATTHETHLRRLLSGDCVGEMSLITGDLPSATVRALTDVDAWALSQDDFQELVRTYHILASNINFILSERLSHTSRLQVQGPPQQITLVVAEASPVWYEVAQALAVLTDRTTLFVDLGPPSDRPGIVYHMEDLLSGRLQGTPTVHTDQSDGVPENVVVLQGQDTAEANDAESAATLLSALSRLEDDYSQVLILIPPNSAQLTASLLTVATRIFVAGAMESVAALRSRVSTLPMPTNLPMRPEIGVIMTDARSAVAPTIAVLDRLSEQVGTPVRAVFPAEDMSRKIAVTALARRLAGQRIGIAFGGGGVKGWAHLGALRVLHRLNVPFDCVTGVSIGAICAAIVARGGTLDEYAALLQLGASYAFHPRFSRFELLSSRSVARFLRRNDVLGERLIEELATPFAAVAADLNTGSEIVIRRGLAWQAVLASAAIPGLFSPVRIGAHVLVDGTVTNPVPISTARLLDADKIIAIDISATLSPRQEISTMGRTAGNVPNMVGSMLRSFEIMAAQIRERSVEQPSVLIKPKISAVSLRRFRDGAQFVEAGEAATEAALPQLFSVFPWLSRSSTTN